MVDKIIDCTDIVGSLARYTTSINDAQGISRPMLILINVDGKRFAIKMVSYEVAISATSPMLPDMKYLQAADAEMTALRLIRKRVIRTGMTPCVVELLSTKICSDCMSQAAQWRNDRILDRNAKTPENTIIRKLVHDYDLVQRGALEDRVAFIAVENLDITLIAYIHMLRDDAIGRMTITSFLWMIIYTIGVLKKEFPGFRHNDMHLGNIMVYFDWSYSLDQGIKYIEFSVGETRYWVPFLGVLPKIIDFGMCAMPSERMMSNYTRLAYYSDPKHDDLRQLFSYLYRSIVTFRSGSTISRTLGIIDALCPQQYHSRILPIMPDEPLRPFDLLNNEVFREYRSPKDDTVIYSRYGIKSV